ncbi:MAG TPA: hypothetical protein VJP59_02295 [Gemmatimonadota bacterium]|nr:hypothetical protein [Gemmatimonadota bacterium]
MLSRRAIVHVHSVYSHDACDEAAQDELERTNEPCLERFRRALCDTRVDAAFLTEHDRWLVRADSLAEALLFRPGDRPVVVEGRLVANRLPCGTVLFAGAENVLMPVGFDSLPGGSREERRAYFDAEGPDATEAFHRYGAVVLMPHPESAPAERIAALRPDGIEVYNPHSNFAPKHRRAQGLSRLGAFVRLAPYVLRLTRSHPDLALLSIFHANHAAIDRWDALLSRRMVFGFGASDAHENALPIHLADGDRGDSYFRMLPWVTNALLVEPPAGPVQFEAALRRGRFYAVLEAWGTPSGFDFHLRGRSGAVEMGRTVRYDPGQRLIVRRPSVSGLAAALPEPGIRIRLYRIEGRSRTVVADSRGSIDAPVPGPGAYRVEVGIVPRHLSPYLGDRDGRDLPEVPWIYSNPVRVVP